jgi:hypothetical protein
MILHGLVQQSTIDPRAIEHSLNVLCNPGEPLSPRLASDSPLRSFSRRGSLNGGLADNQHNQSGLFFPRFAEIG